MSLEKKSPEEKLKTSKCVFQGTDTESLKLSFLNHLECSLAKDENTATTRDLFKSLSLAVRDRLVKLWITTQRAYYDKSAKRVYYLSMEFLIGRTLGNAIMNLGLDDTAAEVMGELGYDVEELKEIEFDAGLGNGGLGRLAACSMDSMATLELPAYGYGIRYEYGIFFQRIRDGYQIETPDNWLRYGNTWEIERPERLYLVRFYGRVNQHIDEEGASRCDWVDTQEVMAMAYDTPVPGYQNNTVNTMRLWSAKSTREFDLAYFNDGDYERAVSSKAASELISQVLYPNDNVSRGKELRLKQEYFFVSATLQDIVRRYKKNHSEGFDKFADKVAIQLNDTHPAVAIPELIRILLDIEEIDWEKAWGITVKTFGYTNHTILPEALEKWSVGLFGYVLPRHLQIIYEINHRFLEGVRWAYRYDNDRLRRMSVIEEGEEKKVRMANLAVIGSHSINGVSALHTEILKKEIFKDFYEMWPERFTSKTNGITQRRWLKLCNPGLSTLISKNISEGWVKDLYELKRLTMLSDNKAFQKAWQEVKRENKELLAEYIKRSSEVEVNLDSIFDCQVKRFHEYKRQLLNVLHVVTLYNRIKANPDRDFVPRTVIFAGKAAPGYYISKLIIKLINSIAGVVNNDGDVGDRLKVVFLENYGISVAEKIIPGADLSEQISTTGTEASGTGNMKFALNGALTIGTLDGANIEIREEVGEENIFIFGLTAEEINCLKRSGYNPRDYYRSNPELKQTIDMIENGFFLRSQPELFRPIVDSLLNHDHFMLLADFAYYLECQKTVSEVYKDQEKWTKMSILNVANMGKFSSDRTIKEYAEEIWGVKPVHIKVPGKKPKG
jgi:starch phosphorylase